MKKGLLLLIVLLPFLAGAQDEKPVQFASFPTMRDRRDSLRKAAAEKKYLLILTRTDSVHSNFIKFNLARLLFLDFAVSYERKISRKVSIEAEFGYQCPIEYHNITSSGNLGFNLQIMAPGQGYSFMAGPKIYRLYKKRPGFYLQPWAIFKYMWCTNVSFPSTVYDNPKYCYPFGDNHYQVYGASLRIGVMQTYHGVILDFYTGIGLKYRVNHYTLYGYHDDEREESHSYNKDRSPVYTTESSVYPFISLGLKLGFGF
jgi:hypothetical protein